MPKRRRSSNLRKLRLRISNYRSQAANRKQKTDESLSEFSEFIKDLVEKGYPDDSGFKKEMRESMAIDYFRNGIKRDISSTQRKIKHLKDSQTFSANITIYTKCRNNNLQTQILKVNN